jgi:hypothetical protein
MMYGTHSPFNEQNLPLAGWNSSVTTLWAAAGNMLVRRTMGADADVSTDWTYRAVPAELANDATIADSDLDGLSDEEEYSGGGNTREPTDPLNPDSDGDGLEDWFEIRWGLDANNSDSDGNGIPDGEEINPETGRTYLEDQLGYGMDVAITASRSDWVMGASIGSNGWVRFELDNLDGIAIWATVREGGLASEAFTYSVNDATVVYEKETSVGGFTRLNLLLVPNSSNAPSITINDGGTYWTNQLPDSLGPDISANFEAVKVHRLHFSTDAALVECDFTGGLAELGDPCAPQSDAPVLVIYRDWVLDGNGGVGAYNIYMEPIITPSAVTPDMLGALWAKLSGPASGTLSQLPNGEGIFDTPTQGGLYQMGLAIGPDIATDRAGQILLPLAGPDVTDYFNSEVTRYETWLQNLTSNVAAYLPGTHWFHYRKHVYRTVGDMMYKGDIALTQGSSCPRYGNNTVTLAGHVIQPDQIGNILYAYVFARAEYWYFTTWFGGHAAQLVSTFELDHDDDQAAYRVGFAFGQHGGSIGDYLSDTGIPAWEVPPIQDLQSPNARYTWPSGEALPTTNWVVYPVSLP